VSKEHTYLDSPISCAQQAPASPTWPTSVFHPDDEDFAQDIQLHLMEMAKNGYIRAEDVVDYIASPQIQAKLGSKACGISACTARHWLKKLNWQYGRKRNGMWMDMKGKTFSSPSRHSVPPDSSHTQ
jgi:hypothetical protein